MTGLKTPFNTSKKNNVAKHLLTCLIYILKTNVLCFGYHSNADICIVNWSSKFLLKQIWLYELT